MQATDLLLCFSFIQQGVKKNSHTHNIPTLTSVFLNDRICPIKIEIIC